MNTIFPAGIDSFDIRSPQEIIRATHVNDIQEAIVAIEVFTLVLDQTVENHIEQATNAHDASAITVSSGSGSGLEGGSYPITADNVQEALKQIKEALDTIESLNNDITDFQNHLNEDINSAHPGDILGSKIADSTISENKLSFDITTQAELDTHINASSLSSAHPNVTIDGYSDISDNSIPESKLSFDISTQAELDAHINNLMAHDADSIVVTPTIDGYSDVQSFLQYSNQLIDKHISASSGVHGLNKTTDGYVVGTTADQRLENKSFISDNLGTKVLLFTKSASDIEKEIFAPTTAAFGDTQLHIREPAGTEITSSISGSPGVATLTVNSTNLFSPTDTVTVYEAPGYSTTVDGYVTNVNSSTSIDVFFSVPYSFNNSSFLLNTSISNPLFAVESDGYVTMQRIGISNIDSDLTISGKLTIQGNTSFNSSIIGPFNVNGSGDFTGSLNVQSQLTTDSIINNGQLNNAGDLIVDGTSLISGNATFESDVSLDNNLYIDGYISTNQSSTASSFTALTGLYNGIDLELFKDDFESHLESKNSGFNVSDGYFEHHTDDFAYSSLRIITPDPKQAGQTGVLEIADFVDFFDPNDGYIQVDTIGVFEVGDSIAVGDDGYGYDSLISPFDQSGYEQGRTIQAIDADANPYPTITLDNNAGLELLSPAKNARIIKKLSYDTSSRDDLTKIIDAIAMDTHRNRIEIEDSLEQINNSGDLERSAPILNNQSSPQNVTGLILDPDEIRSAYIEYSIYRNHPGEEVAATGTFRVVYKSVAGTWLSSDDRIGDTVGVTLSIDDSTGQVKYTSSNLDSGSTPTESVIKFRTRTTRI